MDLDSDNSELRAHVSKSESFFLYFSMDDTTIIRFGWLQKRGLFTIWFSRFVVLKIKNGIPLIHYYTAEDQVRYSSDLHYHLRNSLRMNKCSYQNNKYK